MREPENRGFFGPTRLGAQPCADYGKSVNSSVKIGHLQPNSKGNQTITNPVGGQAPPLAEKPDSDILQKMSLSFGF
jgi:hypothetical protein